METVQLHKAANLKAFENDSSHTHKRNGVITGFFFIAATVSAIIGVKLYDPILVTQDHGVLSTALSTQVTLGAVFELILACAAMGTSIMLFTYLKRYDVRFAVGYVVFRALEVVFILVGIVSVLMLLSLNQADPNLIVAGSEVYKMLNAVLKAMHNWTFILGPHFMLGVNTFIYSYVFYRTKLVPRPLALLGLGGAMLIFATAILGMFNVVQPLTTGAILLALPVASFEMILASWLIIKGFNVRWTDVT